MATVYAIASAKGGVGKTTTTAALATILADSGADVVAIDADLGMANLAGAVGVTPGETTLHDVLAGAAEPAAAVREGPARLRVVPGAADLDAYAAADPSELRRVVGAFDGADYVFVDAGAGMSHDSTLPLAIADETLLVSTPERSALGDTEKTRQLTERLGGTVAGAAITRVTDDTDEVVTALLDATVLGRIPDDEAVARAAAANRPLLAVAPDAPATRAYRDLARALTGADVDGAGLDEPAADAAGGAGARGVETEAEGGGDDEESGDGRESGGDGGDGEDDEESEPETADDDAVIVDDGPGTAAGDAAGGDRSEAGGEEAVVERDDEEGTAEDDESDGGGTDGDEDIIVADPDPTGVAEPGDGDDIIVASEDEAGEKATDPGGDADGIVTGDDDTEVDDDTGVDRDKGTVDGVGSEVDGEGVDPGDEDGIEVDDGDTETEEDDTETEEDGTDSGEEGVDRDDDDPANDEGDAIPDADETAREAAAERDEEAEPTGREPADSSGAAEDVDEELAGSIPFRDDDTGTMNTVLAEEDAEEGADGESRAGEESSDEDDDEDGGFFSRLLGR